MNCPRCAGQLQTRLIGTVEVDECQGCKGMWFDTDELRKAKDEVHPNLGWMDVELWKYKDRFRVVAKPLNCPVCEIPMATLEYDQTAVTIDYCPACQGIWLDGGEFRNIIDALSHELDRKSASEYVRASLEEAKEILTGPEGLISEWRDFLTVIRLLEYRLFVEHASLLQTLTFIQRGIPLR